MREDEKYIRRAIDLARQARDRGNNPFGALLVAQGEIILEAENTVLSKNNPIHHAEMNLVQLAWHKLPAEVIQSAALFSSTEPCPMCTGAIYWSGIRRVVFSFSALEFGKLVNDRFCVPCTTLFDKADKKTEVIGPILAELGREVHEGFWRPA